MSWFLRGVQSALFHYASCAPCFQYAGQKKRRKQAKQSRKARMQLEKDQPGVYAHPEPTGTNPFWQEEIDLGPGPPPRRAKKSNSSSQRGIVRAGTHSTIVSQGGSSIDVNDPSRLSEDTLDDDNWNRKRYQREDEYLWGLDEPVLAVGRTTAKGSSLGVGGILRPNSSKGSADSYYTARVPPVNDLHPPVVSLPSPNPSGNQWMLQPPPKASVMSGKERAKRSRSGSGQSSRVDLSIHRQVSSRQSRHRTDHGSSPEKPQIVRGNSYSDKLAMQRNERPKTPHVRPPSTNSSRRMKRRDTAWSEHATSGDSSSDTFTQSGTTEVMPRSSSPRKSTKRSDATSPPKRSQLPKLQVVQVRSSRQRLSTVLSSGDAYRDKESFPENQLTRKHTKWSTTQSSESMPYLLKHHGPLTSSDVSSLRALQDLVPTHVLLNSHYVSAPLLEARIRLPPSNADEEKSLNSDDDEDWPDSGFAISREWGEHPLDGPVPFDASGVPERDPKLRWSVDF